MYRVILSRVEGKPVLLVVNIVTSPISTDCGWSAPVVGLYRQAEGYWELCHCVVPYIVEIHVQITKLVSAI